jgi:two-component system cell cycle response regulator
MVEGANHHRILVVDDSALPREIIRGVLAEDGYEVVEAEDGMGGITAALELLPDLVISDVMMPDISGYQLCRFLKHDQAASQIPIILMTATELSNQHRFWGMRSGADLYVAKEAIGGQLRHEVATLLAQVQPGSVRQWALRQSGASPIDRNIRNELASLLDQLLFQTTIAQEVRRLATYVHDPDKWLAELASLTRDLADFTCMSVHLAGADGSRLHVATKHKISKSQLQHLRQVAADKFGRDDPLAETPGMIHPSVADLVDESLREARFPCHCAFGLQTKISRLGSLAVFFDSTTAMTAEVLQQLSLLAQELAPVAYLAVTYRELQHLSVIDNLTLLFDERYFRERLAEAFDSYQRHQQPFSVLLVDVDFLEKVNAQHGHATGDAVLRQLAQQLRAGARRFDVLARSGDDELAMLLPETSLQAAAELAEWYRDQVANTAFGAGHEALQVTVSLGVAEVSPTSSEGLTVLWEASAAVCEAKQAGRNQVRTFQS